MHFRAFIKTANKVQHATVCVLFLVWMAGLMLGLHIASNSNIAYHAFCYAATREPAGLTGLFAVFFLPFFTELIAARYKKRFILFAIVTLIGFVHGYNLSMLNSTFGAGAWVVRFFMLFSHTFMCFMLLWLVHSYFAAEPSRFKKYCIIYSVVSVALCAIDFFFISNFISNVL